MQFPIEQETFQMNSLPSAKELALSPFLFIHIFIPLFAISHVLTTALLNRAPIASTVTSINVVLLNCFFPADEVYLTLLSYMQDIKMALLAMEKSHFETFLSCRNLWFKFGLNWFKSVSKPI